MRKFNALIAVLLLGIALSACEKEGPAERAGKELDKAGKEVGQAMERAADSVKESTKGK
jgi:TRAP-type C4-dicarboxylate transport system substrate-binding protein